MGFEEFLVGIFARLLARPGGHAQFRKGPLEALAHGGFFPCRPCMLATPCAAGTVAGGRCTGPLLAAGEELVELVHSLPIVAVAGPAGGAEELFTLAVEETLYCIANAVNEVHVNQIVRITRLFDKSIRLLL